MMQKILKPTPHFETGRRGHQPLAVVIHIATASLKSCDAWFNNRASKVSAHYCVGKSGEIHQYVSEQNTAWHAGTLRNPTAELVLAQKGVSPNYYTIGIEHEGKPSDAWPETQYQASAALIAEISTRWSIPIDGKHIIPHRSIRADKTCPGSAVDLARLIELARQLAARPQAGVPATGFGAE